MAPKSPTVTVKALQALLGRIGSASSGAKAILRDRFQRDISISRLLANYPELEARKIRDKGKKLRMVSIDMGIKNLALCEADVHYPSKGSLDATMEILRWEKIDLTQMARSHGPHLPNIDDTLTETDEEEEDMDPYSSPVLSSTAYSLIKNKVLASMPDIILIEKQRWRSGGGSAVLQWTVRVNTLEGMLWAVLETLRSERKPVRPKPLEKDKTRDFQVFAVDPKRVGQYWLDQSDGQEDSVLSSEQLDEANSEQTPKKLSRSKAEKKAKIEILRSWLSSTPLSTTTSPRRGTPTITFKMGPNLEPIRQALCFPSKPRRRKKDSSDTEKAADPEIKKLDDITDCFLQAAAWVSWESNRLQLQKVRERKTTKGDVGADIGDEILLEMIKDIGD